MTDVKTVGLLHPGAMGSAIGAAIVPETRVLWASVDRSQATIDRATTSGFVDVGTMDELVNQSSVIISVCPPASALAIAETVAALSFAGTYVDANAVSPTTMRSIAALFDDTVDGGIIGPPARRAGTTRMYLAGRFAVPISALFTSSPLEVKVLDGNVGAASALKMAFAAWTKGTDALLLNVNAFAEREGVLDDLRDEWTTSKPELLERSEALPSTVGPKAWRFVGEMLEIADSLTAVGLPDGFHRSSAEVFRRLSSIENVSDQTIDAVLGRLVGP